jgi:FkbM family methyltransferase
MRLHFDSELARRIYCDGFEENERHFVSVYLRPGDIFVDAGANIGLFSLIAANRVGASGKVYAFEPSGKTFQRLLENTRINDLSNVQCFQLALSSESGESLFYMSRDGFDAWNSFAHPIEGGFFSKEIVQCETWDRFAHSHGLVGRVAMIKIDVEGWESRVLEGARKSLSREDAPVLLVEFSDKAAESAGFSCKELYQKLNSFGYYMFTYNPLRREFIHEPLRESYPYANLIATKKTQDVYLRLGKTSDRERFFDE